MRFSTVTVLTFLLATLCWQCYNAQKAQGTAELTSLERKYLPEDLMFVKGEGVIAPFYVSIQEETNANYRLYLQWLEDVYGESYPEVRQRALPQQKADTYAYNDPYLHEQLDHPGLAHYPVVGLTWLQIQDYLRWKTDRLNEAVLINAGILNANWNQKDEDSFNTEAYLFEQYQGDVRKLLLDEASGMERPVGFTDGLLYAGFRLPTEAEWDYLTDSRFQKTAQSSNGKVAEPFPYAENHYLRLASWSEEPLYRQDTGGDMIFPTGPNAFYGAPHYSKREYGVVNLSGGVKEWVTDTYNDTPRKAPWTSIMEESGFVRNGGMLLEEDGLPVEKNYLGHMRNFRLYGTAEDGEALFYGDYAVNDNPQERVVKGGTWNAPSTARQALLETSSDPEVSFRTVITYLPKDKLKWSWPDWRDF